MRYEILMLALMVGVAAMAGTNYVDRAKGIDAAGRGTAEAPWQSLQYAANNAPDGNVVLVAPGVYDNGGTVVDTGTNRVYVSNKRLHFKATGARSLTIIQGAKDPDDPCGNGSGIGPNAVRCIRVSSSNAKPVIFEGFTLAGGACFSQENQAPGFAGGLHANGVSTAYLVDCTITNCVGQRGAATYSGTMVRCFVTDCRAITKGAASYRGNAVNCVVAHIPTSSGACFVQSKLVNCTLDDVIPSVLAENGACAYNTICTVSSGKAGDANADSIGNVYATNCVYTKALAWADKGYSMLAGAENCNTNAAQVQFVAPLFNDYRLLPESDAVNAGDAAYLNVVSVPDEIDLHKDFLGNPIATTGAIHAGAVQATFTPQGGLAVFLNPVRMEGGAEGMCGFTYAHACAYPTQWHLYSAVAGSEVYSFYCNNATDLGLSGSQRFPEMDEGLWMMPPPAGLVMTNRTIFAAQVWYADPTADAASADGSAAKPFRTLQAAVNASTAGKYTLIHAAAGDYREGSGVGGGFTNRVAIGGSQNIRIKGAGADRSVIYGELDTTSDDRGADGRGAHAKRCLALLNGHVQGFTLADGRSAYLGNASTDYPCTQGGCVYASGTGSTISDCVITNGAAWRGGAMMYGRAWRCRFVDCWGGNGIIRYTYLYSCQVDHMANCGAGVVGSNAHAYHTTVSAANGAAWQGNDATCINNIFARPATASPATSGSATSGAALGDGNVLWKFRTVNLPDNVECCADPAFVDDVEDLRLLSSSPALGCGTATDLYKYYCSDLEGNPLLFVDGKPTAGARQVPVQAVVVTAPASYGSVTKVGTNALEVGESITVTAADTTRHAIGFRVDGRDVLAGGATWTYTATDTLPAAPLCVEAIYSTNWYVNASAADDSGDGFTPATATQTFKGLFDKANILAGDCVHAAEGVYDRGDMAASTHTKARLAIPVGVAVVADGAVEKTLIVGHASTDAAEFVDARGRGTNAVRGVYMVSNAAQPPRLRGFTITGGRTCGDGTYNADNNGGGVYCTGQAAYVSDCIISNNAASRGGGVHQGRYVNCRLFWNYALKNRAAVSEAHCFGCILDHNRGINAMQNSQAVINCTFGADNLNEDGSAVTPGYSMPYGVVYNCLFLGKYEGNSQSPFVASDCVFNSQYRVTTTTGYGYTNCTFAAAEELQVDDQYRPIRGACAALDAGSNLLATVSEIYPAADVHGSQRIYNGRIDAGACEYDWRAKYAADLGNASVAVTQASPEVTEAEGRVRVPDGATLTVAWTRIVPADYTANFSFASAKTGAGDWTLAHDGQDPEPVADGVNAFTTTAAVTQLMFAYAGDAAGYADLSAFRQKSKGTWVFLR